MTPLISSSPISCVELWKDKAQEPGQAIRGLLQGGGTDRWLLDFQDSPSHLIPPDLRNLLLPSTGQPYPSLPGQVLLFSHFREGLSGG